MGLITTPRSAPILIVWSSLNLSDRLQHFNHNNFSKIMTGVAMQIQKPIMEVDA
jgi:hypothetical protein